MRNAVWLALAVPLVATPCLAESFRCPNGSLVQTGDSLAAVSLRCDKATSVQRRTETVQSGTAVTTVQVEEWSYNFGSTGFLQTLVFRDGLLTDIRNDGRGR
jgi:hypothetical protein